MDTNSQFIESIKNNDRKAIALFYGSQKESFVAWARSRFDCDLDTIIDVYQDAIVTLYHNVLKGKITEFTHTPEAYLFGMTKNLMYKRTEKNRRLVLKEDVTEDFDDILDYNIYQRIDSEHKAKQLTIAFSQLQENCTKLLKMFYYQRFSTEAIMHRMEYSSVDVVKSRKNQCMKQLKKIMSTVNL